MTSKRNPNNRNLGPVIALTGAGIAAAAVIAGFIVIGGPGDARDRRLDEIAMERIMQASQLVQCAFNLSGAAPATIEEAGKIVSSGAAAGTLPNCPYYPDTTANQIGQGSNPAAPGDTTYEKVSNTSVRYCGNFRRPFAPSKPAQPDYRRDDYFGGSWQDPRPKAGPHCYEVDLIRMNGAEMRWDDTIAIEALPPDVRNKAEADKRAIGDVVNVLRMARCARDISGEAPASFAAGIETIRAAKIPHPHNCSWAPSYFDDPNNVPVVSYSKNDNGMVSVCADYAMAWPTPLRLDYYAEALDNWPGNLAELQQSVEAGHHCYTIDLIKAPPDFQASARPTPAEH